MKPWIALMLLLVGLAGCSSKSGPLFDWCEKRDYPRLCEKYL